MLRIAIKIVGIVALLALLGTYGLHWWICERHLLWRDERYVFFAGSEKTGQGHVLGYIEDDHPFKYSVRGLVFPGVFSVGANAKYIVVKSHPSKVFLGPPDRSTTNYYIVKRTDSWKVEERLQGIRGPMSRTEFDYLDDTMSLPPFSKTLHEFE